MLVVVFRDFFSTMSFYTSKLLDSTSLLFSNLTGKKVFIKWNFHIASVCEEVLSLSV